LTANGGTTAVALRDEGDLKNLDESGIIHGQSLVVHKKNNLLLITGFLFHQHSKTRKVGDGQFQVYERNVEYISTSWSIL
jgi:hypothetical protein